jgi:adenylyltransferase/sulfurtransferase
MKDIAQSQPKRTSQISKTKLWLYGCGAALVLGTIGFVLAARHNPDVLVPLIKAGVPLKGLSNYSSIVKHAYKRADTPRISSHELKQLIDSKATDYMLLDVRTPEEYKISKIPGAVNVPITEIQNGLGVEKVKSMLNGRRRLIAYCTHGYRSGKALVILDDAGIKGEQYEGGIQEWTEKIDPSLPRNGF